MTTKSSVNCYILESRWFDGVTDAWKMGYLIKYLHGEGNYNQIWKMYNPSIYLYQGYLWRNVKKMTFWPFYFYLFLVSAILDGKIGHKNKGNSGSARYFWNRPLNRRPLNRVHSFCIRGRARDGNSWCAFRNFKLANPQLLILPRTFIPV